MKIKTADLIGPPLNWAVAKCELQHLQNNGDRVKEWVLEQHAQGLHKPDYSEDWMLMGPIIQREEISLNRDNETSYSWAAWTPAPLRDESEAFGYGNLPLIAACRCCVESILGDEVEVPDCLIESNDFTGKSKIEILRSFGYEVTKVDAKFKSYIVEDSEAFSIITETEDEAIDEAYQFLMDEVDPDLGYIFPSF
ncbi:DUF2591 family protein [Undibacterium sp. RTI2.1]|uniref:phage protein NinX family protein n=1 Tax=unclassified Undibacterium TaxID=2630295 RepID=UPI002AB3559C|nr:MULTISPECIES: phage protein NinX family protein [unclassified Undibacterium]MDY7540742.1 DUF2591 family protein [Undibacterium sp. 5I1]MEB0032695.1 DUF2591 family protein [Undibacterium sp. RTI2.1]MEB0118664.1 DUF2591 family protein [Undibacterium sp. RTI2.2]MEB0232637.1 DUF2591 family protein [Undibacterium sp. 10I3]MEB0259621.1 DUF2591 family protein [Undibacterium sp. 5I1]